MAGQPQPPRVPAPKCSHRRKRTPDDWRRVQRCIVLLIGAAFISGSIWFHVTDRSIVGFALFGILGLLAIMLGMSGSDSDISKTLKTIERILP